MDGKSTRPGDASIEGLEQGLIKNEINHGVTRAVDALLEDFLNTQKGVDDIVGLFVGLNALRSEDRFDYSMTDEQVGALYDIITENYSDRHLLERLGSEVDFQFEDILMVAHDHSVGECLTNPARLYSLLIDRVGQGEKIPGWLINWISFQRVSVEAVPDNIRIEFVASLLQNPLSCPEGSVDFMLNESGFLIPEDLRSDVDKIISGQIDDISYVLSIISVLNKLRYDVEDYEIIEDSDAGNMLEEIAQKVDNYFIQKKIEHYTRPLSHYSIDEVRSVIQNYWSILVDAKYMMEYGDNIDLAALDPMNSEEVSDDMINSIIENYQSYNPRLLYEILFYECGRDSIAASSEIRRFLVDKVDGYALSPLNNVCGIVYAYPGTVAGSYRIAADGESYMVPFTDLLKSEGFLNEDDVQGGKYQALFDTYRSLMDINTRALIEKDIGIQLDQLTMREQLQLVYYLSSRTGDEVDKVKRFLDDAQSESAYVSRMRSFLSLEFQPGVGKHIINIGEELGVEVADLIFEQYARLVDASYRAAEALQELVHDQEIVQVVDVKEVHQYMLKRAYDLILDFGSQVVQRGELAQEEVLSRLDQYSDDLLLTASVYKSIVRSPLKKFFTFEQLEGIQFESLSVADFVMGEGVMGAVRSIHAAQYEEGIMPPRYNDGDVPDSLIEGLGEAEQVRVREILQMLKVYKENYDTKPGLQKVIVEGFLELLEQRPEDTTMYVVRKNNKVIAFCRFDDLGNGQKYWGSLNVYQGMQGSAIGTSFIKEVLNIEMTESTIVGDCMPNEAITSFYVEREGFVFHKVIPDYEQSGETLFTMVGGEDNDQYIYFNKELVTRDQLLEMALEGDNDYSLDDDQFVLLFDRNSDEFYKTTEELLNNHKYIVTRYFFSRVDGQPVVCAAYEKKKPS